MRARAVVAGASLATLAAAFAGAGACTIFAGLDDHTDDGDATSGTGGDGGAGDEASAYGVSFTNAPLRVRQGESATATFDVRRRPDQAGTTVTLTSQYRGLDLTITPALVTPGETGGSMTIAAQATAAGGVRHVPVAVAIGSEQTSATIDVEVYDDAGRLDRSFGSSGTGVVLLDALGSQGDTATDVTVQTRAGRAERIVVAGVTSDLYAAALFLAALDETGAPDTTFGTKGRTEIVLPNATSSVAGTARVLAAPDGSLFTACAALGPGSTPGDFYVAHFSADGAPDTSFGDAGATQVDFGQTEAPVAMALVGSGEQARLLVVGDSTTFGVSFAVRGVMAALFLDGGVDRTFAPAALAAPSGGLDRFRDVRMAPDGTIAIAGEWNGRAFVTRVAIDGGSLGPPPPGGALARVDPPGVAIARSSAQSLTTAVDGVLGDVQLADGGAPARRPLLARRDASGQFAPGALVNGLVSDAQPIATRPGPNDTTVVLADIVTRGRLLLRLTATGALDTTFADGRGYLVLTDLVGQTTWEYDPVDGGTYGVSFVGGLAAQSDGMLLVAARDTQTARAAIARVWP